MTCSVEDYTLLTPWNSTHYQLNRNFRNLNTSQEEETGLASQGAVVLVYSTLHSAGALLGIEVSHARGALVLVFSISTLHNGGALLGIEVSHARGWWY